jgi:hypothetical protein
LGGYLGIPSAVGLELNNSTRWLDFRGALQQAGTDPHSTADIWATVYRGDITEQGETVGHSKCSDLELDQIATGPLDTTNGSDIVAWVVVRHHHEPRDLAEESAFLPYHYEGFHITPRAFEIFRAHEDHINPNRPPRDG